MFLSHRIKLAIFTNIAVERSHVHKDYTCNMCWRDLMSIPLPLQQCILITFTCVHVLVHGEPKQQTSYNAGIAEG